MLVHTNRALMILALWALLVGGQASAQDVPDSLAVAAEDTTVTPFSPLSVRLPSMGQLASETDSLSPLHSSQVMWTDAVAATRVFTGSADFFLWDLGEPGQNSQLVYRGLDWRSIALSVDGVPMNDPISKAINLYDLPIEFLQDFEVLSPTLHQSSPGTASGVAVNGVSHQYLSYRPVTKVRFLQGPYGEVFTDGLFTQNLAQRTNLVVGFQRHATDGRFTNASYDAWNLRSRLRVDLSARVNVALTYLYTKRVSGMNGGVFIDSTRTIFQGPGATVRTPEATETVWRHDLAAHLLATLFADTTALTRVTAYGTLHERDYRDPESPTYSDPALDRTLVGGLRLEQQLPFRPLDAAVGGELHATDVTASPHVGLRDELTASAWARVALDFFGFLRPYAHARQDFAGEERHASYGAGVTLHKGTSWELLVGASRFWRFPTLQERFWSDPTVTRINTIIPESHRLVEVTGRARPWEGALVSLSAFRRWIENGVIFAAASPPASRLTGVTISSVPRIRSQGITLDAMLPIWRFGVHLVGSFYQYEEEDTLRTLLPKFRGMADAFFRDNFFNGNLGLRVGARVQGMSRHQGMEFVPPMLAFVGNRGQEVGHFASLDLYGVFRIGDAFVTLAWENILNVDYYITPVYPMLDRSITLGIDWQFLD